VRRLRLQSEFVTGHENLGLVYAAQKKLPEAVAEHREALRLRPDDANIHNNLGKRSVQSGQAVRGGGRVPAKPSASSRIIPTGTPAWDSSSATWASLSRPRPPSAKRSG